MSERMKFILSVTIEIVDSFENNSTMARIFYPNEGNKIMIKKGLNTIEFSEAIHHEIGHLFDWYLSKGKQSLEVGIREKNADIIGNALRYKNADKNPTKQ